MAITTHIYPSALEALIDGSLDLDSDTLKLALLNGATFDDTNTIFTDVSSNEITGTGYTAGGRTLTGVTATLGATAVAILDADDVVWPASTLTASSAVLYDDTATGSPLIGFIDFDGPEVSFADSLTVAWDATGILRLAEAS